MLWRLEAQVRNFKARPRASLLSGLGGSMSSLKPVELFEKKKKLFSKRKRLKVQVM
jgi:hypothetical protein